MFEDLDKEIIRMNNTFREIQVLLEDNKMEKIQKINLISELLQPYSNWETLPE